MIKKIILVISVFFSLCSLAKDAPQYYQLGNKHFDQKEYAQAFHYYLKANQSQTINQSLNHNLNLTRSILHNRTGVTRLDRASNELDHIAEITDKPVVSILLSFLFLLSTLYLIKIILSLSRLRVFLETLPMTSLIYLVLFGLLQLNLAMSQKYPKLLCVTEAIVRTGPSTDYAEMSRIQPGFIIRKGKSPSISEDWIQIKFSPDQFGWVKKSSLLPL